jgi:hypothetical protein
MADPVSVPRVDAVIDRDSSPGGAPPRDRPPRHRPAPRRSAPSTEPPPPADGHVGTRFNAVV